MATKTINKPPTPSSTASTSGPSGPRQLGPIPNRISALSRLKAMSTTTGVNTSAPVEKVKTLAARQTASQTTVQRTSSTTKKTGYIANEYGRCEQCKREIKKETLAKNGGQFCGNCKRSKDGNGKPNKRKTQEQCKGCDQPFSLATLTKYKHEGKETGRCKKCHDKFVSEQNGGNQGSSGCIACELPHPSGDDFGGFCLPCTSLLMEMYYLPQLAVVVREAFLSGEIQVVENEDEVGQEQEEGEDL